MKGDLMRRVIMTLDMTEDEARAVSRRIDDLGLEVEGMSPLMLLESTVAQFGDKPRLQIMLRTDGSNELGGSSVELKKAPKQDGTYEDD